MQALQKELIKLYIRPQLVDY